MEGNRRTRRGRSLWKTLKQRLVFNAITICGSSMTASRVTPNNVLDIPDDQFSAPRIGFRLDVADLVLSGMNLATALAAERGRNGFEGEGISGMTFRSMLLLERLQGGSTEDGSGHGYGSHDPEGIDGFDSMGCCCVCLEGKKDAALIPCGHTYCRGCSLELLFNGECCPLCNRSITDVLHIF